MKLKPKVKKEAVGNAVMNDVDVLKEQLKVAEDNQFKMLQEVKNLRLKILLAENAPVKEGSVVECDLFIGRNQKRCKCVVKVEWSSDNDIPHFKVYPYKGDGEVSSRGYFAPVNIKDCLVEV